MNPQMQQHQGAQPQQNAPQNAQAAPARSPQENQARQEAAVGGGAASGHEAQQKPHNVTKMKVLIAEDNESNYMLYENMLEGNYELIHAWNGEEAVELFEQTKPDIILMDISMPKMDGYEATSEIKRKDSLVPIIAVTAYAFATDKERMLESGFNGYVSKPINHNRLKEEMAHVLKNK